MTAPRTLEIRELLMAAEADPPSTDEPETTADRSGDETTDAPVFANRAERRAKGRGKSGASTPTPDKGGFPGSRGAVQSRRNYGTRRSG